MIEFEFDITHLKKEKTLLCSNLLFLYFFIYPFVNAYEKNENRERLINVTEK